ncbi:MAG TPA: hypothetical protein VHB20_14645 [Verrucomicrobiae bacterium]|jgi:hypothetical protein|nr:hypothetical protein [Verrucomicrobiae bacterium]
MDTSATLNPIMSGYAAQFMREAEGFVGRDLFPPFPSAIQSASYYVFTAASLANVPKLKRRAPGSAYPRIKRELSNDSFACSDYGVEAPVPDEDRKKYGAYFNADLAAIHQITDTILFNHEKRVHDAATDANVVPNATPAIKWSDAASDPKSDVDAAKENIRKKIGLRANLMIISEPVFLKLQYHPKLVDLFKFTSAGVLPEEKLAAYLGIKQVKVAYNIDATNNEGQVFNPADIWGNDVVIAHVESAIDLTRPNFGRTFYWTAFSGMQAAQTGGTDAAGGYDMPAGAELIQISSYRDEKHKSDIHRAEHYVTEKMVGSDAGFYLANVL